MLRLITVGLISAIVGALVGAQTLINGMLDRSGPVYPIIEPDWLEWLPLDAPVYPVPDALIERFSIERVPVILSQEGKKIKIEEVLP